MERAATPDGSNSSRAPRLRLGASVRRLALLAVAAIVLLHVAWPPVYEFRPARPFAGPQWYDPYADDGGTWLRANFHAHSRAWGGLTFGTSSPEEVRTRYREEGYDVYALSNYQLISPPGPGDGIPIPAYEHGLTLGGQHQLIVGARRVSWLVLPLPQGVRQKQYVLDRLAREAPVVIINHPMKIRSYSVEDMALLSGYTGVEIATKYTRSRDPWDAALSAGRPVWGFCSDDGHQYELPRHAAIGWIMLRSADRTPEGVLDAIQKGRFYGIWTRHQAPPNALRSAAIRDGSLQVDLERPADEIRFVGQGGRTLSVVRDAKHASYRLSDADTYVRAEAVTGDTSLFLNPVFRYSGAPLANPGPAVDRAETWALRAAALAAYALLVLVLFRRRAPPSPAPDGSETARSLPASR